MAKDFLGLLTLRVRLITERVSSKFKALANQLQRVHAIMRRLNTQFRRFQRQIRSTTSAFGPLLLAFGGFEIIRSLSSLENALARVKGITNASAKEMEFLQFKVRQLGENTQYTATQAAEAAEALARAGFKSNEIFYALEGTLRLAIIGQLGMGEAAGYMANQIRAFNLPATEAMRVVDALAAGANNANHTIPELAQSLNHLAPIAKTLGINLETSVAQIALLAQSGIKSERAGTTLKQTNIKLATASKEAERALAQIGLRLEDINPQRYQPHIIMERLNEGMKKIGDQGFTVLAKVFGARAVLGVGKLTNSLGEYMELMREIVAATGSAGEYSKRLADIMQDTMFGAAKRLVSAFMEMWNTILFGPKQGGSEGLKWADKIKIILDGLAESFRWLTRNINTAYYALVLFFAAWKGAAMVQFAKAIFAAIKLLKSFKFYVLAAAAALKGLAAVFLAGIAVASIVSLIEGIYKISEGLAVWKATWKALEKTARENGDNMDEFFRDKAASFREVWKKGFKDAISAWWDKVMQWAKFFLQAIGAVLAAMGREVKFQAEYFVIVMKYGWKAIGQMVVIFARKLEGEISNAIGTVVKFFHDSFYKAMGWLVENAQKLINKVREWWGLEPIELGFDSDEAKKQIEDFAKIVDDVAAKYAKRVKDAEDALAATGDGANEAIRKLKEEFADNSFANLLDKIADAGFENLVLPKQDPGQPALLPQHNPWIDTQEALVAIRDLFDDIVKRGIRGMTDGMAEALLYGNSFRDVMSKVWEDAVVGVTKWLLKWLAAHALVMIGVGKEQAQALLGVELNLKANLARIKAEKLAEAGKTAAGTAGELTGTAVETKAKIAGTAAEATAEATKIGLMTKLQLKATAFLTGIKTGIIGIYGLLKGLFLGLVGVIKSVVVGVVGFIVLIMEGAAAFLTMLWLPVAKLAAIGTLGKALLFAALVAGAVGLAGGFRKGGIVRGPGTGTSDSIPAWLSAGEFVVPAAATANSRGLLEQVRSGNIDDRILAGLRAPVGGGGGSVGRSLLDDVPDPDRGMVKVDVGGPRLDGRKMTRGLNEAAVRRSGEGYTPRERSLA